MGNTFSVGSYLLKGFCGVVGDCNKEVKTPGAGATANFGVRTNCQSYQKFSLKSAMNYSVAQPCTNYLLICPGPNCKAVVWRYNSRYLYEIKHYKSSLPELAVISEDEKKAVVGKFKYM